MAERRTGLVYDERCLAHVNPPGGVAFGTLPAWATVDAFERPERLSLTRCVLEGSGVLAHVTELAPRLATAAELRARPHRRARRSGCWTPPRCPSRSSSATDAWTGPGTHDAMLLAAGGLMAATEAVLDGTFDNAFALLRPPGHHAERDAPMGFCLFNNTAIAARWAQRERGVERVAIVDWDVHHGNGTEEIFLDDPSVLTISLHQDGALPGRHRRGSRCAARAPARARTSTSRCPPATGDDGYLHAFERVVAPVLRAFRPDLLLVGAGQDASATDPLGRMSLTVARLPRAGRPRRRDRRRAVRRAAGRDARGRLLAAAPAARQPGDPRGARRACRRPSARDPIGADVPRELRDVEREYVAAAERAHVA